MSFAPIHPGRPGRADPKHEGQCRRCGVSCHLAVPLDDRPIMVPGLHCQFLLEEPDGRFSCTVYNDRFDKAPWCHHADLAAPLGFLADDCPYALKQGISGGKVRLSEDEMADVWPQLLERIRSWGVPVLIDRAALLREVSRREGSAWTLGVWPGDPERLRLHPTNPED